MALTKAEKIERERLLTELSFRWPTEPDPVSMVVPTYPDSVEGWRYNFYSCSVDRVWVAEGRYGYIGKAGTRSLSAHRESVRAYATEREAWIALRWAMCREYAGYLRALDRRIDGLEAV
jgi:hypothetical protein